MLLPGRPACLYRVVCVVSVFATTGRGRQLLCFVCVVFVTTRQARWFFSSCLCCVSVCIRASLKLEFQRHTAPHGAAHTAHSAARRRTALPTRQMPPHGAARRAPHGNTATRRRTAFRTATRRRTAFHTARRTATRRHTAPHGAARHAVWTFFTMSV